MLWHGQEKCCAAMEWLADDGHSNGRAARYEVEQRIGWANRSKGKAQLGQPQQRLSSTQQSKAAAEQDDAGLSKGKVDSGMVKQWQG